LDHQNNYVERLNNDDDSVAKSFNNLAISLSVLHNYFGGPNKIIFKSIYIFYIAEILNTSAKAFSMRMHSF